MPARELWKRVETIHAVTYFAQSSIEAARAAGLRGFWMGYFGFRAAPMGPVGPAVVEAAFANFAPAMVRRAIPDAWHFADPVALVAVRAEAAAAALRRLAPGIEEVAGEITALLAAVADAASPAGRPLFAANRELGRFDDPVEELWQRCTTLREHRGDGHVAALVAAGVDGCASHLLLAAEQGVAPGVFLDNRGWDDSAIARAVADLAAAGLLIDGELTAAGRRIRREVERVTDELALTPITAALSGSEREDLLSLLDPWATRIAGSGVLPYPNPMGLPALDD